MVSASAPRRGPREIQAAGVVTFGPGRTVLLVHRPKYDDWSFPKGKLSRAERAPAAAVREVLEETGVRVRLTAPLTSQGYRVRAGDKTVHYWTGRPVGAHDVSSYIVNAEIDDVRWVPEAEAAEMLTYPHDRDTLAEALAIRKRTRTVVVVRHGLARSKKRWRLDDRLRPLIVPGHRQAQRLIPLLAAYGVTRMVSSGSMRCTQTIEPYAARTDGKLEIDDTLSAEDATHERVQRLMDELLAELDRTAKRTGALALCTHRQVLPWVLASLGLAPVKLEKGELLVAHLRGDEVVAVERHRTA
jgi:8-oxo-dGTP pyrophosphatase MutT (NUDIX family)/phosphohistidine phosphatase SixA